MFLLRYDAKTVGKLQRDHFYDKYLAAYGYCCSVVTKSRIDGKVFTIDDFDNMLSKMNFIQALILTLSGVNGSFLLNELHALILQLSQIKVDVIG